MKPDLSVKRFRSQAAWATWLEKQHQKSPGIWLEFAKKSSGIASVNYLQALEVALCYGWIDGQVKSVDATWTGKQSVVASRQSPLVLRSSSE